MHPRTHSRLLIGGAIFMLLVLANASGVAAFSPQAGVEIVFEAQPLNGSGPVTTSQLNQASVIVQNRLSGIGASQFSVHTEGADHIVAQILNVDNSSQITATLQQPGFLEFIDAGDQSLAPDTLVQTTAGASGSIPVPGKVYQTIITGQDIDPAGVDVQFDDLGKPEVAFKLQGAGAKRLADFTASNINKYMPILLDKKVIASPQIEAAIPDGTGVINNLSSVDEAKMLSSILKYGSLPVRLTVIQTRAITSLDLPSATTPTVVTGTTTPLTANSSSTQGSLGPIILVIIGALVVLLIITVILLMLRQSRSERAV